MIYYNNQANDLTDMTNGWDYVDTVNTALQSLADAGRSLRRGPTMPPIGTAPRRPP